MPNDIELMIDRLPDQSMINTKSPDKVGLVTNDYPHSRFRPLVGIGDQVVAGAPLMVDRRRGEYILSSPVSGTVSQINYGQRKRLQSVVVDVGSGLVQQEVRHVPVDSEGVKKCLQESGLWPALRARPFGCIADPDMEPAALFVTAMQSDPMAPEISKVIDKFEAEFVAGISLLSAIYPHSIYLCVDPYNESYLKDISAPFENVVLSVFGGLYPAGLPGTHIHMLEPVKRADQPVWHIDYQDVISFGHLKLHGMPWNERVVSLVGPAIQKPRTLMVPLGASIADITVDELLIESAAFFSGSVVAGKSAVGVNAFLGRYHHQISAVARPEESATMGTGIGAKETKVSPSGVNLIPFEVLEHCLPKDILVVPFLRALLVGDADEAKRLGVLSFVEEDLALARLLCCSGANYPRFLRHTLDQLATQSA